MCVMIYLNGEACDFFYWVSLASSQGKVTGGPRIHGCICGPPRYNERMRRAVDEVAQSAGRKWDVAEARSNEEGHPYKDLKLTLHIWK